MRLVALIVAEWRLALTRSSRRLALILLALSLLLPLFVILALGQQEQALTAIDIALVTDEQGQTVDQVQAELDNIDLINVVALTNEEEARRLLAEDQIALYIVFPDLFFDDALTALDEGAIEVVLNPHQPGEGEYFARFIDELSSTLISLQASYFAYADLIAPLYSSSFLFNLVKDATIFEMFMRILARNRHVTSLEAPQFDVFAFVFASLLVLITLFFAQLPLFYSRRDKSLGIEARFYAVGVRRGGLLLARLLSALPWYLLALIPVLLTLKVSFSLSYTPLTILSLLLLWLFQALIAAALAEWGAGRALTPLVAVLILVSELFVAGIVYPQELLPGLATAVASHFPAALLHDGLYSLFTGQTARFLTPGSLLFLAGAALLPFLGRRRSA